MFRFQLSPGKCEIYIPRYLNESRRMGIQGAHSALPVSPLIGTKTDLCSFTFITEAST